MLLLAASWSHGWVAKRKLHAFEPTTGALVGAVLFLNTLLWFFSLCQGSWWRPFIRCRIDCKLWQRFAPFSLLEGVIVELRCTWAYPGDVLFFWFSLLAVSSRMFCVYRISHNRLCKRASSPSCIRPCTSLIVALFVKRDESLFWDTWADWTKLD